MNGFLTKYQKKRVFLNLPSIELQKLFFMLLKKNNVLYNVKKHNLNS